MERDELKDFLDSLCERYEQPGFIEDDPIAVPHLFTERQDREIAGFLAAAVAWGNRRSIVRSGRRLMALMGHEPHRFVLEASDGELAELNRFAHRTFNGQDCVFFVRSLRSLCLRHGGLGEFFQRKYVETGDMRKVLSAFRRVFLEPEHPERVEKHVSCIDRGSACKRLNMYVRWMVRRDGRGVDFGLWDRIPPSALYLPLDVHTGATGRALGLLDRRQNDWKAVEEITGRLAGLDPHDPVRYDFALFGAGIHKVI